MYAFNVVAFGLCNAPAFFQRTMLDTLGDLVGTICFVFIDDIVIFSKTSLEHVQHVRMVLERLKKHNLIVNLGKCSFAQREISYLGHVINDGVVKPDQRLVDKLEKMPEPSKLTELRSVLGLAGFYRRFIRDYALTVDPLVQLKGKVDGRTPIQMTAKASDASRKS